jgi:hypothetical protein
MDYKAIIKGFILKYIPILYKILSKTLIKPKTKSRNSARYYYTVYLRHLIKLNQHQKGFIPEVIAEIGPGSSLGVGFTALLTGTSKYYGFDVIKHSYEERNLEIFDEIYTLLKNRTPLPNQEELPSVHPHLDSYDFPSDILTDELLEKTLNPERKEAIIELIKKNGVSDKVEGLEINYVVPWEDQSQMNYSNVDLIISQAVMEHVDMVELSYQAMYSWLNPGGFISHQIDYKSHHTHKKWYGHWTIPNYLWKFILSARSYPLNRYPHSQHIKLINKTGFTIKDESPKLVKAEIDLKAVKMNQFEFEAADLGISGAYISAQKS